LRRRLLEIADAMRALAGTGLHYTQDEFDRDRYRKLMRLAAEAAALTTDEADAERIAGIFDGADRGYVTPKVDVRMAVFRGDSVLLVRERADRLWALPGGWADVGDAPSEAATRETAEEAGLEVRAEGLAGVFDYRLQPLAPPAPFHIYKLVFVGVVLDARAEPRAGAEVLDATFHALDALPDLSQGRTLPLHIETARRMARGEANLTHFD
jgi:ADP-ribose pyrophosphatase YjhB (NUDIX family)